MSRNINIAQNLIEKALDDIDAADESYAHTTPESATYIMLTSIAQSLAAIALILIDKKEQQ